MQTTAEIKNAEMQPFAHTLRIYLVALSAVALLSLAGYFSLKTVIQGEKTSSTLINVSGRQRRLSLSVAYCCLKLTTPLSAAEKVVVNKNLNASIEQMQRSHDALTKLTGDLDLPRVMSPTIKAIYFAPPQNLDDKVRHYLNSAKNVLNNPNNPVSNQDPDVLFVNTEGPGDLLKSLDQAVSQYQQESQTQISQIEAMELTFLLVTLVLLGLEATFIFFPMSRKLQKQVQTIVDSQQELNAIFDTVGDALITFDGDQQITTANHQAQKIWETEQGSIIGKPLNALIKNSHEHLSMTGPNLLGTYMESEAVKANGDTLPLEMIVTKTNLSDRVLYTVSLRDITERKSNEKRISEFYSIVAHELRSPLTSIQGTLQILQGGLAGPLTPEARKFVDIGVDETVRLMRLINDFLDLKKIAAGNFELAIGATSLYAIAGSAVTSLMGMASQSQVKLQLTGSADLMAQCDRDRILQVLNNLISNAIKFSPAGADVVINVDASENKKAVRCSITDKGPGIAVADMPKLFAMFQQVSTARESKNKGTGLGLAISKALIEQHGGTIGIDSAPGKGSTFWFELPAAT